jgi:hypothetical protein
MLDVGAKGVFVDLRSFYVQVNTERTIHRPVGVRHVEGGWPENVDSTEIDQVDRFLKKALKVCVCECFSPFFARSLSSFGLVFAFQSRKRSIRPLPSHLVPWWTRVLSKTTPLTFTRSTLAPMSWTFLQSHRQRRALQFSVIPTP